MLSYARSWGYDQQDDGTEAVLSRLVFIDPERASAIVAHREDPENRVEWLAPLVRSHSLPASAEPVVDALLELGSPGKVSPCDMFDMKSAPGRPPMVAWVPDPGVP